MTILLFSLCSLKLLVKEFVFLWKVITISSGKINIQLHFKASVQINYYYYYYYYGPGDAIARVSRSSMVALHTLLSCVLYVASCSVRCSSLQSSLIISIHLFFCLPLFLVPCTYSLYAILGYRSFFIRFRCPKYRSRLFRILSIPNKIKNMWRKT